MSTFRLHKNGVIYLYQWLSSIDPFKVSTGLKIDSTKWNKDKQRPKSSRTTYKGLNITAELIRHENAFQEAWNYFQNKGGRTKMKLKKKYKDHLIVDAGKRADIDNPKFLNYYSQKVQQYKVADRNNWKGYNNTLNHLKKFFGKTVPDFEDIDMQFYVIYNDYLLDQGLSVNSISDHWKFIKAIMKKAHHLKYHNNSDYQQFKRFNEQSDTVFLSIDELTKVYNLELKGYLNTARDYFIIGCYTGLRYGDWDKIELSKINDGFITIHSQKTGLTSSIPIHERVINTLKRYDSGKLPSKPSNQKMNDYIKSVALRAGIDEKIETKITKGGKMIFTSRPKYALVSTHTARRSFATNLVLLDVSPYLIMRITGHRSLPSFERYIRLDELQATNQLKEIDFFKSRDEKAVRDTPKGDRPKLSREDRLKLLLPKI